MIDAHTIAELKAQVSGEVILPNDPEYEQARTVLVDKGSPALVIRPKTSQDTLAAVTFAKAHSLAIAVKSGGHSNGGFSTNHGGLVIDVMHFDEVTVLDADRHFVRIGSGALWGNVAKTLGEHGLALSSGDTKTVGVGGLTLGGGIGWMVRKYGLTIDRLRAAEVVTGTGEIVRASADENPELFWAIRGGGGNFGVVTYFEFEAEVIKDVVTNLTVFDFTERQALITKWRDAMRKASEEVTSMIILMPGGPMMGNMPPRMMVMSVYAGDDEAAAEKALKPLVNLGNAVSSETAKKPYAEILEDAHMPQGLTVITNNAIINNFSDEAIETIAAQSGSIIQIRSLGGAMNKVDTAATAFGHRNGEVLIVSPVFASKDASSEAIELALHPWLAIERFSDGGYSNFFSEAGRRQVEASYPLETRERLSHIKFVYDPENIFSHLLNVAPHAS